MTTETWTVLSLHTRAVRVEDGGYRIADGTPLLPLPTPVAGGEGFPSMVEAESWRLGRLEEWRGKV